LFSGDLSADGLFIPTEAAAELDEVVELELTLPDNSTLPVLGRVVNLITREEAARHGKPPGLGISLEEPTPEFKARFDQLLAQLKGGEPRPIPASDMMRTPPYAHSPITEGEPLDETSVDEAMVDARDRLGAREGHDTPRPKLPPSSAPLSERRPGIIVGIDLGTTFTSVGAVVGQKVKVLPREDGTMASPSVVSFERNGDIIVGQKARERVATHPARTMISPKRILGRKYNEREVQTYVGQAPFRTLEAPDGTTIVEIGGNQYAVTQIIGYIMKDAREWAEKALGQEVTQAVVSVPISFEADRIAALRRAGQMAGLEVVAVIDEPSAAALANRFDPNFGGTVGVYDFGGGTFDFSVVDVSKGDFKVLATAGDTWLGGDDFDRVLAEAASNQFWREHKVDLRRQAMEWQRLLFACEQAKRDLSTKTEALIHVPNVLRTSEGMVDLKISIDRAILERATAAVIQRSLDTCAEALELLGLRPNQLTSIYLSGGTTYIPCVRDALNKYFQVPVRTGVPAEYAVCLGAAIHAAQIQFQADRTLSQR
jgi:molecular chaperone DnaK (HSP70)/Tfp pilus assembly protein PilZ